MGLMSCVLRPHENKFITLKDLEIHKKIKVLLNSSKKRSLSAVKIFNAIFDITITVHYHELAALNLLHSQLWVFFLQHLPFVVCHGVV